MVNGECIISFEDMLSVWPY